MKTKQTNLLNMSHATSVELTALVARSDFPPLAAAHERLKARLAEIERYAAIQAQPVTGKTVDRDRVFAAATQATLLVARLVLSYARAQGHSDLAARVTLHPSTFVRTRTALRPMLMQQVHDAAASVLPQLIALGVTAERLADLQARIDAAEALHSLPRSAIVTRKVATKTLALLFRDLVDLFKTDIDPLVDLLAETLPGGCEAYRAARIVIKTRGTSSAPETPAATPLTPAGDLTAAPTSMAAAAS